MAEPSCSFPPGPFPSEASESAAGSIGVQQPVTTRSGLPQLAYGRPKIASGSLLRVCHPPGNVNAFTLAGTDFGDCRTKRTSCHATAR
jgi:hypothetical protein